MNLRKSIADTGAVLEGEFFFVLKSGRVSTKYINIDPLLTRPNVVKVISGKLVKPFERECNALAGPAIGGIPLIYGGADALRIGSMSKAIKVAFAEKQKDGSFAFERMGFADALKGRKVVVLEDIVTTGDSAKATCELVRKAEGELIGVSVIWNRGAVNADTFGVPAFEALITETVETWQPGEHEKWGVWPIVSNIGHPENFATYNSYEGGLISL